MKQNVNRIKKVNKKATVGIGENNTHKKKELLHIFVKTFGYSQKK